MKIFTSIESYTFLLFLTISICYNEFKVFFFFLFHVCLCFVLWTNLFLFILSLFRLFKLLVYIVEFWIHVLLFLCCYNGSHSSIMMLIGLLEELFVEVNLSSLTHFQLDIIASTWKNVPIHVCSIFCITKYRILCDLNTLSNNNNWMKHRNTTWSKYVEDQNNFF